jgi:hypothetical protein
MIQDLRTEEEKQEAEQREIEKRSYRLPGIDAEIANATLAEEPIEKEE